METVFSILLWAAGGALVGGALGSPDPIGWLADGLRGVWDTWVRMYQAVAHVVRAGVRWRARG
jgi:hypothetical protein